MTKLRLNFIKLSVFVIICMACSTQLLAQQNHTSFFMRNTPLSLISNPASMPDRGYVSIPALGAFGVTYLSNGLSLNDIFYKKGGKLVTFMDSTVSADSFIAKLKNKNSFNIDNTINILGAGWYTRQGSYWNIGINAKTSVGVNAPKSLLEFMKRDISVTNSYNIRRFDVNARSYAEAFIGYSRKVASRWVVGGRVKLIAGLADVDMKLNQISATHTGGTKWAMMAKGSLSARIKGISSKTNVDSNGVPYINGFDFDGFGFAGWGGGIDLGASFRVLDNLTVYASVLDFGFISWRESSTVDGKVDGAYDFDGFNPNDPNTSAGDQLKDLGNNIMNMVHLSETAPSSKTTMLRSTINIGGEYSILNNKLGFGLLSSTQLYKPKAYSEVTVSVNGRPCHWFSASLSYSFVYSGFKSIGIALNFHPSFINFFLGSDYMFFSAKKGVPQFAQAGSFYLGMSVPLGRNRGYNQGQEGRSRSSR